jgi:hypothetical protein
MRELRRGSAAALSPSAVAAFLGILIVSSCRGEREKLWREGS